MEYLVALESSFTSAYQHQYMTLCSATALNPPAAVYWQHKARHRSRDRDVHAHGTRATHVMTVSSRGVGQTGLKETGCR